VRGSTNEYLGSALMYVARGYPCRRCVCGLLPSDYEFKRMVFFPYPVPACLFWGGTLGRLTGVSMYIKHGQAPGIRGGGHTKSCSCAAVLVVRLPPNILPGVSCSCLLVREKESSLGVPGQILLATRISYQAYSTGLPLTGL